MVNRIWTSFKHAVDNKVLSKQKRQLEASCTKDLIPSLKLMCQGEGGEEWAELKMIAF